MEGLVAESKQVLASKLQLYKPFPEAIASTAAKVYEVKASFDAEFDSESRKLVAKAVVQVLKAIMDNEDAEKHLTEDPELMRDVIALAAERLHTVQGLVAQPTNVEPRVVGLNDAQMWNVSQDVSTPVHSTPVTKRPGEALESEMRKKSKDNSA